MAQQFPDRVAVVDDSSSITYRELIAQAWAVASGLIRRGIRPGDPAVMQSGNTVQTIVALYGLILAGAVPVCALPQHREKEISDLIALTRARVHVAQADWPRADLAALAVTMRERHDHLEVVLAVRGRIDGGVALEELVNEPIGALPELNSEGLALLQLSGGTTGTPKLIPRLHCDYVCNARTWGAFWGWDERVVSMHVLPIMHNAGLVLSLVASHMVGGTAVLAPRVDPAVMAKLIEQERVSDMVINATVAFRMLESPEFRAADTSSLRRVCVGPQNVEHAKRFEEELGLRALGVFGMGEGLIMATPWNATAELRRNTVGVPIHPLDEVRLVDENCNEVATGEVGELTTRGPYTILGYYDAETYNAGALTPDGFFRTGDLARATEVDGRVYYAIEGRIKDNIDRGGEKINADEIESQLSAHPAVVSAAIVAMPDPELGEKVCAYIVARGGQPTPTVETIATYLLEQGLAKFKLPERVELVTELPLTPVGKVAKKQLRADITAKLEAQRWEAKS
ncbi:(2,3-dihydroxybenzoyl)adenylate synthase [Pseudarthrobacter sp. NPDC055928]|uniref:(2,3-dihydroxybenzoyl)adenylate synthase n=1 Tax=Pseudarthrobacter sp. NPDC055928 TaxID=3345661 RepID=UPI0035D8155C